MSKISVSKTLLSVILSVWRKIGGNFPEDISNIEAIEVSCDADRLECDNTEAYEEFLELTSKFESYEVYKEISDNLRLV